MSNFKAYSLVVLGIFILVVGLIFYSLSFPVELAGEAQDQASVWWNKFWMIVFIPIFLWGSALLAQNDKSVPFHFYVSFCFVILWTLAAALEFGVKFISSSLK